MYKILIFIFWGFAASAQSNDLSDFYNLHSEKKPTDNFSEKDSGIFSALHSFYKCYIASQDANTCVYTPSCSDFALLSVKKNGFLISVPAVFDRLVRCNARHAQTYPKHPKTGLAEDYP